MDRTRSFEHFFFDGDGLIPPPERLRKVLVVGAGVAGLQAARQMLKLGAQVLILEANDEVGGVWTRNYIGFGLQVPWRMYEFPEFPWPKDLQPSSEYPTGQEVQAYVLAYCREYGLRRYIHFNCKLLRLRWCAASRQWDALYCDTFQEKFFQVTVDYTIICAGIYSQPYIPDYEGTDSYAGIQLHAKDFVDLSLARGRRVVIVGAGKTALDCVSSIVATNTATSVTLLYRQAHWPVPRRMLGTSVRRLLFNRAMTAMMPLYYTAGSTAVAVSKVTAPLRKLFWRNMESVISRKFRITEQMRPRVHLPADLFYGGQILDNTMDKLVRSEALLTIKGEINRFVRNGVILQDGDFLAADLVLYCTGYLKTYDYLEGEMRSRLDLQKDGLYLYRNCLPYAVPHLAFIGSEVSTYNNILTHGLQALWLAHVLSGRIQLPSPAAMADDVRAQQRWRRAVMPAQRSRGSVLMLYMMHYHDQLLEDMGQAPHRKGLNVFAECFGSYTAADYKILLAEDDTVLDARLAEEELAAAGVPPAVLAAAAAGRSGVVAGASVPPPPPPGSAGPTGSAGAGGGTERRSNGGVARDMGTVPRGNASVVNAAAALHALTSATNLPLDNLLFSSSNRGGTLDSIRSPNGQEYRNEQGPNPAAMDSISLAPGSGGGRYGGAAQIAIGAATRAFQPNLPIVTASTERVSQNDWSPDSMSSPQATIHRAVSVRRAAATVSGSGNGAAVAVGAGANSLRCTPVWARNDHRRGSAREISLRVSTDMATAGRWGESGVSSCYSDGGPVNLRRPATATSKLLPALAAKSISSVNGAVDPCDTDPRPISPGADRAVPLSPGRYTSSADGDDGHGCTSGASEPPPSPQVVAPDRLAVAGVTARRGSFSSRSQREFGVTAPSPLTVLTLTGLSASGSTAAAMAAGYPSYVATTSTCRLARHTGPTSPIPCHSTHTYRHHTTPKHVGQGDSWGPPEQQLSPAHPHPQQHVKWSLLSSADEAAELPLIGGRNSGSGNGGALQPRGSRGKQVRLSLDVRSSLEMTPSAAGSGGGGNVCDSSGLLRDGFSENASGGSCEEDCCQSPSAGPQHSHNQHVHIAGPMRSFEGSSSSSTSVQPNRAGSPKSHSQRYNQRMCYSPGHQQTRGIQDAVCEGSQNVTTCSDRGSGNFVLHNYEDEKRAAENSDVAEVCPVGAVDNALEGRKQSLEREGRVATLAVTEGVGHFTSPPSRRAKPSAVAISLVSNGMEEHPKANSENNNGCFATGSSSGRSRRLSICSRSSADSNTSCGSGTSSSPNVTEARAVVFTRGGRGAEKVYPVLENPESLVAVDGRAAARPSPSPSIQLPLSSAQVLRGSVGDCRHNICGSLGGASETAYGSPGSSAISLSLWHALPVVASSSSSYLRQGCAQVARMAGAPEHRFSAMERLVEAEQTDADEMDHELNGALAVPDARGGIEEAADATAAAMAAADASAVDIGPAGAGGPAAIPGVSLIRAGISAGKSPRRGSIAGSLHLLTKPPGDGGVIGVDNWRRAGSLARSVDGMSATLTEGSTGVVGVSSQLLPGAYSTGAQSTGSSGAQIYSSISLAGGLTAAGSSGVVATPAAAPVSELFIRQPSRLSSCPTVDSMTVATLDANIVKDPQTPATMVNADSGSGAALGDLEAGDGASPSLVLSAAPKHSSKRVLMALSDTSPFRSC